MADNPTVGWGESTMAPPPPDPRITWEGCSVLLDINDGDRLVFARLSSNASLKIGNKKCALKPLIGCPFGSLFRVESGPNVPFLARSSNASSLAEQPSCEVKEEAKDNRALIDNNTAQSLSSEDIDAMRSDGATGDEIIEALIANSSTYENKTVFSQEKYKLKKQKKYAPKVLLRRPFARSICEAYFKKHPARIGFLRMDTLSLLLSMANVSAYSDVLVVDMVGGLITGAIAERLGGTGYVCSTYFGAKQYPFDIVRLFNLSGDACSRIVQASFPDLTTAQPYGMTTSSLNQSTKSPDVSSSQLVPPITDCISCDDLTLVTEEQTIQQEKSISDDMLQSCTSPNRQLVNPGRQASEDNMKQWKQNGFTSLVVAAPELDVSCILEQLLPLLAYSAPFAIYHQFLQPLTTCMHKLQTTRMAVGLKICEPWLREYQVLPSRTHPHMQMSSFGGYILSGTRICNRDACNGNK